MQNRLTAPRSEGGRAKKACYYAKIVIAMSSDCQNDLPARP